MGGFFSALAEATAFSLRHAHKKPRAEATAFAVRTGLRRRKLGSRMAPLTAPSMPRCSSFPQKSEIFGGPMGREGTQIISATNEQYGDADSICY